MIEPQRPPTKVTLEDLLRLKRAERPPAEFWMEFERSLRAKQLAALVEKRPWWRSWRSLSTPRWSVPLGAAAAIAFTLSVVGPFSRSQRHALESAVPQSMPIAAQAAETPGTHDVSEIAPSPRATVPQVSEVALPPMIAQAVAPLPAEAPSPVQDSPRAVVVLDQPKGSAAGSVMEQVAGLGSGAETETGKPLAPSFASTAPSSSGLADNLNAVFENTVATLGSELHAEKVSYVEPLTEIASPRDAHRARLLAFTSSVDTHSPQYSTSSNVIRSRDRIASHLSEEALYDSIRRLGIKNGGVSIQF